MKVNITRYTPSHKDAWDSVVETARNGHFLFYRNFMEYHSDRFADHSLIIFNASNQLPIAVFPANEQSTTIYSHQGLTYGGLIIGKNIKIFDVKTILAEIMRYYYHNGYENIIYKKLPYIYSNYPCDEDLYWLHRTESRIVSCEIDFVFDMNNPCKTDRKINVKKAMEYGATISLSEDYQGFWGEVLVPLLQAKHNANPVHSIEEIEILKERFPENIYLLGVFDKDKNWLAGSVFFKHNAVYHTQYIATTEEGKKYNALDLLFYKVIKENILQTHWISFGTSFEQSQQLNTGLVKWKESWGARALANYHYNIKTENYKLLSSGF